jgi:hypothetical protein
MQLFKLVLSTAGTQRKGISRRLKELNRYIR